MGTIIPSGPYKIGNCGAGPGGGGGGAGVEGSLVFLQMAVETQITGKQTPEEHHQSVNQLYHRRFQQVTVVGHFFPSEISPTILGHNRLDGS